MPVTFSLVIKIGPSVEIRIAGQNCHEISQALEGFEDLNVKIDSMCGDLAERIYPEGQDPDGFTGEGGGKEEGEEER
jgi:hypothetical protein